MNGERHRDAAGAGATVEHVVHVANREVCARFAPMLVQVWRGLSASGLRLTLLTDDHTISARVPDGPAACHCLPNLDGWRTWNLRPALEARISAHPNIVHLWGTAGLWPLTRWARGAGAPVLVHALGALHVSRLLRGGLRNQRYAAVGSQTLAAPLLARDPMTAGRCWVVPPAIAPPLRAVSARPAGRTCTALCVGAAGVEVMIAAIAELRRQGRDLHAALLEPGRNTSAIWRHITARHVQPCISLMNDAGLWEKVLPEVDACVVPAPQYELTIVPLLAMALGKLVIAARDQPAEWFLEDRTAWQFTPGSAVELAYLLVRAIEQPRRVEETGQRAAEYVRVHHSVRELVTTLTGLYRLLWTRSGDVVPPEQPR